MAEAQKDFKHIVRIRNTDLVGAKPIGHALRKIKGVNVMFANALCNLTKVDWTKTTGHLSEKDIEKLNGALDDPKSVNIPTWMLNRRRDMETGEDKHLLTTDLKYQQENDIKMLRKTKSYKGVRHSFGLPARGQSTKSNFRRNKGKGSLGVKRKGGKGGRV